MRFCNRPRSMHEAFSTCSCSERFAQGWSRVQDMLAMELARSHRDLRFPDRLHLHRKGKPGQQDEQPLAHELRCFPNTRQVSPRTPRQMRPVTRSLLVAAERSALISREQAAERQPSRKEPADPP